MGQKKIRAVLDTNVLVSALLFAGPLNRLVSLWREGRFSLVVSGDILVEYLRVLAYPKFGLAAEEVKFLIEEVVLPFAVTVNPRAAPPIVREDPADDKILHAAVAGRARFIVSGDGHLLALGAHRGARIVTAREFLGSPELS
jgi:putative PIN family toxin of toxin-antitoxin system